MKEFALYIHIPFCVSKCTYCDFFSVPCGKNPVSDEYVQKICKEIEYSIKKYQIDCFSSVYFGGGTPSLLNFSQVEAIMQKIRPYLKKSFQNEKTEISFELNCDDVRFEYLNELFDCGINRFSVGIQTLNEKSLNIIQRRSSSEIAKNAIQILSDFQKLHPEIRISADFIAGLPETTKEDLVSDLAFVIKNGFTHISLYSLSLEEGTKLYKQIETGKLDYDEDYSDEIWISGRDFLIQNGFEQYEISNFARNTDGNSNQSAHNKAYWHGQNYVGVGAGAVSTIYDYSYETQSKRITNKQNISEYLKCTDFSEIQEIENLDKNTLMFEYLMTGFRTKDGVDSDDFFLKFNEKIEKYLPDNTKQLIEEGKMIKKEHTYRLSTEGMLFLNQILIDTLNHFKL